MRWNVRQNVQDAPQFLKYIEVSSMYKTKFINIQKKH